MASTAVSGLTSKLKAACRKAQAPEPRRWRAESPPLKRSSALSNSLEKMKSKPTEADLILAILSSVGVSIAGGEGEGARSGVRGSGCGERVGY